MENKIEEAAQSLWIKTDDTQFVKKIDLDTFEVIDVYSRGADCGISRQAIDLKNYDKDDIWNCLSSFGYSSMSQFNEIYGDKANQIIAECLSESYTDFIENLSFKTIDEAVLYIESNFINAEQMIFIIKNNNIGCKEVCPICKDTHKPSINFTVFEESTNKPICRECQEKYSPELRKMLDMYFENK